MKSKLTLNKFQLKNFKAVSDSNEIKFTPLTVFIGNNGAGKSSVVEGLEAFQQIVLDGLDVAMFRWRGFQNIYHKEAPKAGEAPFQPSDDEDAETVPVPLPMEFYADGILGDKRFEARLGLLGEKKGDWDRVKIDSYEATDLYGDELRELPDSFNKHQITDTRLRELVEGWQFLNLGPQRMMYPALQKQSYGDLKLNKDGSNIAEYLEDIRSQDVYVYNDIIKTLQRVLPYAKGVQPSIVSSGEQSFYLSLQEKDFKLPGWLLSQGTLRILALLSVFRHPAPPHVIVIEEIENGLDPRTIHMVVEEIKTFLESGLGQVIVTTHSPYLLDLLDISQIVVVERDEEGYPQFKRPTDDESLMKWAEKFAPGQLYTMGNLTRD